MEKKLTNSGPLMEPADKHSIYTIEQLAGDQVGHIVGVGLRRWIRAETAPAPDGHEGMSAA